MAVKSLKEQLSQIALKKVKLSNGETLAETMAREARRLYDCIQYYIDKWYNSYEPAVYNRTYRYQGALYAEDVADVRVVGDTLRISLCIHDDLDYHENLEEVYWVDRYDREWHIPLARHISSAFYLMEYGWKAPKLARMLRQEVDGLTHFDGINAINHGIEDYNAKNPLGIKIEFDEFDSRQKYKRW